MFENSRAALAFAGITIVGAAFMIGPGEGSGVLDKTVDRYADESDPIVEEAQDFADEQSVHDEAFDPASGWASGEDTFSDYQPDAEEEPVFEDADPASAESSAEPAALTPRNTANRTQASPPVADTPGELVPRPDQGQARNAPSVVPVITGRRVTITPQ